MPSVCLSGVSYGTVRVVTKSVNHPFISCVLFISARPGDSERVCARRGARKLHHVCKERFAFTTFFAAISLLMANHSSCNVTLLFLSHLLKSNITPDFA